MQQENELTRDVEPGQPFDIYLDGNYSTGYRWVPDYSDPTKIRLLNEEYTPNEPVKPGSSGTAHFKFEALNEGTEELHFLYVKPWKGGDVADRRDFSINIK